MVICLEKYASPDFGFFSNIHKHFWQGYKRGSLVTEKKQNVLGPLEQANVARHNMTLIPFQATIPD